MGCADGSWNRAAKLRQLNTKLPRDLATFTHGLARICYERRAAPRELADLLAENGRTKRRAADHAESPAMWLAVFFRIIGERQLT
jgi:hypothetical protein